MESNIPNYLKTIIYYLILIPILFLTYKYDLDRGTALNSAFAILIIITWIIALILLIINHYERETARTSRNIHSFVFLLIPILVILQERFELL